MKRLAATALALLIALSGCGTASGGADADAGQDGPAAGNSARAEEAPPADAGQEPEDGQGVYDVDELLDNAYWSVSDGGHLMLIESPADNPYENGFACRYLVLDGSFDETMRLPFTDNKFVRYITDDLAADAEPLELTIDAQAYTVRLRAEKHNYTLDFAAGTLEHEIIYREQDLDLDNPVAVSPGGGHSVYLTYRDGAGEWYDGDYVALDGESGEIRYLCGLGGTHDCDVFFVDEDSVFFDRLFSIDLIDARTGEALPGAPRFDFGGDGTGEYPYARRTAGSAYDPARELFLIAYCPTGPEAEQPVGLAVYDRTGGLVRESGTGLVMTATRKGGNFYNRLNLELDGSEAVLYANNTELGRVAY